MGNTSVVNAQYEENSDPNASININKSPMVESIEVTSKKTKKMKEGKAKKIHIEDNSDPNASININKWSNPWSNPMVESIEVTTKKTKKMKEGKAKKLRTQSGVNNYDVDTDKELQTVVGDVYTELKERIGELEIILKDSNKRQVEERNDMARKKSKLQNLLIMQKLEVEDIKLELEEKLDKERCRCETLQNDLDSIEGSHESQLEANLQKHRIEKLHLEDFWAGEHKKEIFKAKEEHSREIEELKTKHHNELVNLRSHHDQVQDVLQGKAESIHQLVTEKELSHKTRELEQTEAVTKAMETLERTYSMKYEELFTKLNSTIAEKEDVQNRLKAKENISKEIEFEKCMKPEEGSTDQFSAEHAQESENLKETKPARKTRTNVDPTDVDKNHEELLVKLDSLQIEKDKIEKQLKKKTFKLAKLEKRLLLKQDLIQEQLILKTKCQDLLAKLDASEIEKEKIEKRLKRKLFKQAELQKCLHQKEKSVTKLIDEQTKLIEEQTRQKEQTKALKDLQKGHSVKYEELFAKLNTTLTEKENMEKQLIIKGKTANDSEDVDQKVPFQQLSDELKSLQHVLELRNEDLKSERMKIVKLEKKVEEYYELQTRFESLSQDNQTLKVSLNKKVATERRLSVERDKFVDKFEKESKKVNRLSMEKEEFLWKKMNKNLCASLPDLTEEVEEEGAEDSSLLSRRSSESFSTPSKALDFSHVNVSTRRSKSKHKRSSSHSKIDLDLINLS